MIEAIEISEDLTLAPIKTEDAPALFELIESNRNYLREWLPWLDFNTSVDDSRAFIAKSIAQAADRSALVMTIRFRAALSGVIGFNTIDELHRVCEIGYWVDAKVQGHGIATRSTRAMVECAYNDLGMNKVRIMAAAKNVKSRAIPERLGFEVEGVAREAEWLYDHYVDQVMYAALKSEWCG